MSKTQDLAAQIEQLVRAHIEASRTAAASAVEQAFAATSDAGSRGPGRASPAKARMKNAPRRAPAEVAALGDRLYAAVCATPGETMATLAPQVGASPRALQVAVTRLRRGGKVRSVGERQYTRYFPMTSPAPLSS